MVMPQSCHPVMSGGIVPHDTASSFMPRQDWRSSLVMGKRVVKKKRASLT